ncbi:eCIS core domain-containing protein [Streptomyces mirabilis]|uniref:eCIS core domain-containing protein n=1 Tax=Streptomyces mirabilis TaxID=68239 RepID=UPI003420F807
MHAQGKETDKTRGRTGEGRPSGRAPAPGPAAGILALQRAAGNAAVARAVEEQRHEHDANCGHGPSVQRSAVHEVLRSPGRPLDAPLQTEMEGRYGGEDFSGVRVHTDAAAQRAAAQIGAKAFTSGTDVVWDGQDKHVLAHELDHYRQQIRGPVPGTDNGSGLMMSDRGDWAEVQAEENARRVMSGAPPVQRAVDHTAERSGSGTAEAGAPAIQRTVWTYNASTQTRVAMGMPASGVWQDETNPAQTATSAELGVGADGLRHGDKYDDVTRRHFGSGNVEFSQRGTIPDTPQAHRNGTAYKEREAKVRNALVDAKRKMAETIAMLGASGPPGGRLLDALRSGFPAFQRATPQQIEPLLSHVVEVLTRVQTGLNASGAQIALAGETPWYDLGALGSDQANVAGWVAPTMGERLRPHDMKSEELPTMDAGREGPINLRTPGENVWYIIHEATHRFAGTLDFQYSPYEHELSEDRADVGMAQDLGWSQQQLAQHSADRLGKRVARDPDQYTGQDEPAHPAKQLNWYAMGRRALMNADSYAQFVVVATGGTLPRR